jgi:hypothetical protein
MYQRTSVNIGILGVSLALSGCGGSQAPAESPEQTPATHEPAPATPEDTEPSEGQHTMPDGTTMPGHHHGEGVPAPSPEEKPE